MDVGVFVLGMHRSGTSVATNVITSLGVATARSDDLVPPTAENPKGYWESTSLIRVNTAILGAVGSETGCPTALPRGWENDKRLDGLRDEARASFRRSFPIAPWVWKDPRNCLTFAFWKKTLGVRPAIVLVNRNPLEIAASLHTRSGERKIYALALWERYLRQALAHTSGLPILTTAYAQLVGSPEAWAREATRFLAGLGVACHESTESAGAIVDRGLKHSEFDREDFLADPDVSPEQRALYLYLESLERDGDARGTALPRETPTTDALLAERRRVVATEAERRNLERLLHERDWRAQLRASRYAAPARRARAGVRRLAGALSSVKRLRTDGEASSPRAGQSVR